MNKRLLFRHTHCPILKTICQHLKVEHNVRSGRYPASISPVRLSGRAEISLSGAPLLCTIERGGSRDQLGSGSGEHRVSCAAFFLSSSVALLNLDPCFRDRVITQLFTISVYMHPSCTYIHTYMYIHVSSCSHVFCSTVLQHPAFISSDRSLFSVLQKRMLTKLWVGTRKC